MSHFHYEPLDSLNQAKLRIRELLKAKYITPDATEGTDSSEGDGSENLLQSIIAKLENATKLFSASNVLVVHEHNSDRTHLRSMTAYIDYSNNMRSLQQLLDGVNRDMATLKPVVGYCDPLSIVRFDQVIQQAYTVSDELDDKIIDSEGNTLIKRIPTTLKPDDMDNLVSDTNRVMRTAQKVYTVASELVESHNYSRTSAQNRRVTNASADTDSNDVSVSDSYKRDLTGGNYLMYVLRK